MPTTSSVRKLAQRRVRGAAGRRGQLDRFDDGTWEFWGNGETTAEDIAGNIIQYETKEGNDDYKDVKAEMLARLLLEDPENNLLRRAVDGNPKKAIPVSQSFVAEGETLKALVSQLMAHEKALRQTLMQQAQYGSGSASEQILGTVRGGGLDLPYEPT